jgi:dGTPase
LLSESLETGIASFEQGGDGFEMGTLYRSVEERWKRHNRPELPRLREHFGYFVELLQAVAVDSRLALKLMRPYSSLDVQRIALRRVTSWLVNRFISAVSLNKAAANRPALCPIRFTKRAKAEVTLLKELTWTYVIENPELIGIQHGQKRIIKFLVEAFLNAAKEKEWSLFPMYVRERALQRKQEIDNNPAERVRLIADVVSSLTENQAIDIYQRLSGQRLGTILGRIF